MSTDGEKSKLNGNAATERSSENLSRLGDQFIASLNHDIRTPLSGILGMTELLLETELSEEQEEYISTTKLCADQLMEMMNSALEYAALSAGGVKLEEAEFHLPQSLDSIVKEFISKAQAKGLEMSITLPDTLPEYVVGDAVRLRQLVSPLLANAIKFTASGRVEVTATVLGPASGDQLRLKIEVRDTGIGIPAEKLQDIFDSFRQLESGLSRSYPGMGLGLAVARKLASIMGGEITVDSEAGVGSTFHLTIPVSLPAGQAADLARLAAAAEADAGPRVLLVDDNDVARRVVTHILQRAGYKIDCASGGEEGIQAAGEHRYDLILMDLQMPNVNGLEATAAIRGLPGYDGTPILALSANYSEEFTRACKEAGLQDFLSKPIQRDKLLHAIAQHLQ